MAILPMLPELCDGCEPNGDFLSGEFSSADTVMNQEETQALLMRHGLLEPYKPEQPEELLR